MHIKRPRLKLPRVARLSKNVRKNGEKRIVLSLANNVKIGIIANVVK
jgi:hypothetical protein